MSGLGRYVGITNNNSYGFHRSGGAEGGAIEQESCSDKVTIIGNTLSGLWTQGSTSTSGMELYSRNLTVTGNTISGFANEGIGVLSVFGASVTGNHLYGNNLNSPLAGEIKLKTVVGGGNCNLGYTYYAAYPDIPKIDPTTCDAFRDIQSLTVQNNDSFGAVPAGSGKTQFGINLLNGGEGQEGSTNYIGLSSIFGNAFNIGDVANQPNKHSFAQVAYDPRLALNPGAIQQPANVIDSSYPSYVAETILLPQTIAIFPEGNQPLGAPLGTADPGVGKPEGVNRRFFRFGANDHFDSTGASNVALIQGFFSTAACPALAATSSYPAKPPNGAAGPYASAPSSAPGTPCNLNGQPVGPVIAPVYYCSFAFDPPSNSGGLTGTIYLDNTNPNDRGLWKAGQSPLGSNCSTLSNEVCAIHTSTASTGIQPAPLYCQNCIPNDIIVVLDIELLKTGTWFMYELAEDAQLPIPNLSNSNDGGFHWSLWGFWNVTSIQ